MKVLPGTLQEHWTIVDGWRVFARVSATANNTAPAAVLVHGLGVSSRYMTPLGVNLASSFPVFAPDLPGFGRSAKPSRTLSVRELGRVLAHCLSAAGIERAVVIANSMGCQIVTELADISPESMSAAVLIGPTMDTTVSNPLAHVFRLFRDQFHEPPLLVPLQAFEYLRNGPLRTVETFREALRHDMTKRIRNIRVPVVLMRGERDPISSREWVESLAARLPDASVVEVRGAGHALNYSSPEAVGEVVRALAARLWA